MKRLDRNDALFLLVAFIAALLVLPTMINVVRAVVACVQIHSTMNKIEHQLKHTP